MNDSSNPLSPLSPLNSENNDAFKEVGREISQTSQAVQPTPLSENVFHGLDVGIAFFLFFLVVFALSLFATAQAQEAMAKASVEREGELFRDAMRRLAAPSGTTTEGSDSEKMDLDGDGAVSEGGGHGKA